MVKYVMKKTTLLSSITFEHHKTYMDDQTHYMANSLYMTYSIKFIGRPNTHVQTYDTLPHLFMT